MAVLYKNSIQSSNFYILETKKHFVFLKMELINFGPNNNQHRCWTDSAIFGNNWKYSTVKTKTIASTYANTHTLRLYGRVSEKLTKKVIVFFFLHLMCEALKRHFVKCCYYSTFYRYYVENYVICQKKLKKKLLKTTKNN